MILKYLLLMEFQNESEAGYMCGINSLISQTGN